MKAFCAVVGWLVFAGNPLFCADDERPNVLMIVIDDLNDWVSHLGGHPQLETPNIDRLADRGVSFTNAHTMAPQCHPTRRAFFSGNPPFVSGIYTNGDRFLQQEHLLQQSMFKYFKDNGYYVAGAGKIIGGEENEDATHLFQPKGPRPKQQLLIESGSVAGQSWGILPNTEEGFDAVEDESTVELMEELLTTDLVAENGKPFFLLAGLYKPHLPFYVPQKFYDLHPVDKVLLPEILDTDRDDLDEDAFCFLTRCEDNNTFEASELEMRQLVRSYLACAAYTDYNVGRILDAFDKGPNADRETIIILWSDHGYHLGEKQQAAKRTLWNESTRTPYIWVVPGFSPSGERSSIPVDHSSAYATLCNLAGLEVPEWVSNKVGITEIIRHPDHPNWSGEAVSTYKDGNYSIVADGMRFIRYSTNAPASWELYEESTDPNEWVNLIYGKAGSFEEFESSPDIHVAKARKLNQRLEEYLERLSE